MNKVFRFKPQKRLSLLNPERKTKGQLTLFFGMCMGIGKTHLMLQEGIHLIKDGFDVVLANYNSHGNKEIERLTRELEKVCEERTLWKGKAQAYKEMMDEHLK